MGTRSERTGRWFRTAPGRASLKEGQVRTARRPFVKTSVKRPVQSRPVQPPKPALKMTESRRGIL